MAINAGAWRGTKLNIDGFTAIDEALRNEAETVLVRAETSLKEGIRISKTPRRDVRNV